MKKILLLLIIIIIYSCSSDGDSGGTINADSKLKSISGGRNVKFYYVGNKLSSIEEMDNSDILKYEIIYDGDKIIKKKTFINNVYQSTEDNFYVYSNGNIITSSGVEDNILFSHQYSYNSLGQMVEDAQYNNGNYCCTSFYKYDANGNIKSVSENPLENQTMYTYDIKKNPEFYMLPEAFSKISDVSKNNIIATPNYTYEYEYNTLNLPTKKITKQGNSVVRTENYEYY